MIRRLLKRSKKPASIDEHVASEDSHHLSQPLPVKLTNRFALAEPAPNKVITEYVARLVDASFDNVQKKYPSVTRESMCDVYEKVFALTHGIESTVYDALLATAENNRSFSCASGLMRRYSAPEYLWSTEDARAEVAAVASTYLTPENSDI